MIRTKSSALTFLFGAAALVVGLSAPLGSAVAEPTAGFTDGVYRNGDDGSLDYAHYYVYGGRNYCWYFDAWNGPGYYWCGYAWNRGYGWGGVYGWHGWRGNYGWYHGHYYGYGRVHSYRFGHGGRHGHISGHGGSGRSRGHGGHH